MNSPSLTPNLGQWLCRAGLLLALAGLPAVWAAAPTAAPAGDQRTALRGEKNLGPFSLFDTDHDGTLSPAEIAAAAEVLKRFDKNLDGSLTADELPQRRPGPPPRDRHPGAADDDPPPPPQN